MMTETTLRVADDAIAATSTLKPATIADKVGIWLDTLSLLVPSSYFRCQYVMMRMARNKSLEKLQFDLTCCVRSNHILGLFLVVSLVTAALALPTCTAQHILGLSLVVSLVPAALALPAAQQELVAGPATPLCFTVASGFSLPLTSDNSYMVRCYSVV